MSVDLSSAWLHRLSPEQRAELRKLYQVDLRKNWVLLLYPAAWVAAAIAYAYHPSLPLAIAVWIVGAVCMTAMGILTHEATHGSVFRQRTLDRWSGFLLGAPAGLSAMAYRVLHNHHHRYTRTKDDPDDFLSSVDSRGGQVFVFWFWIVIGTPYYLLLHVPFHALRLGKGSERAAILLEYVLIAGMVATFLLLASNAGRMDVVLHAWAIPWVLSCVLTNVRGWAEHPMTEAKNRLNMSRTVVSNRVVSFLMCNLNYHAEHHLCPGVPWYNLPRLHALLEDRRQEERTSVYDSYFRFLWDAVRTGVHGVTPR